MWPSCLWRAAISRWCSCPCPLLVILYIGSGSSQLLIPCGSGPASFTVTCSHQRAGFKGWLFAKRTSWHHPFIKASAKRENPAPAVLPVGEVPVCGAGAVSEGHLWICWLLTKWVCYRWFHVFSRSVLPVKKGEPEVWSCSMITVLLGIHGVWEVVVHSLCQGGGKLGPSLPKSWVHHKGASEGAPFALWWGWLNPYILLKFKVRNYPCGDTEEVYARISRFAFNLFYTYRKLIVLKYLHGLIAVHF